MISFWILLILPVFHFALTAPVSVQEIFKVRLNAVDVLKDRITSWEKRADPVDEDQWSTNEAYLKKGDNSESDSDSDSDDAPGGDEDDEDGWVSDWDSSDARGPDPHFNNPPESESESEAKHDGAEDERENDGTNGEDENDSTKSDDEDGSGSDSDDGDDGSGDNDHDNEDDDYETDFVESERPSAEHIPLASPGAESEHPASPEHITYFENLSKGLLRPRNSGSDAAVGTQMRELHGIVDTEAYV